MIAGAVSFCSIGFVAVSVFWLRKLRETVSSALTEAAGQQIRSTQRLNESISRLQKQQDTYNQQIQVLAQAGLRLQQEISTVTSRLDNNQAEQVRGGQTLH